MQRFFRAYNSLSLISDENVLLDLKAKTLISKYGIICSLVCCLSMICCGKFGSKALQRMQCFSKWRVHFLKNTVKRV